MAPWTKCDPGEYLSKNLRAHEILKDVPIHDVWSLELPAGGEGRTVMDIRALTKTGKTSPPVRFLFSLRFLLGRLWGWDKKEVTEEGLFINLLTIQDRERSEVPSGSMDGPFTVLYVFPNEAVSEIRNATVHAALVWLLIPRQNGYRMLWAIYVKPVGRLTGIYMTLIDPFRRWIVYPSLLKRLHHSWCKKYSSDIQTEKRR